MAEYSEALGLQTCLVSNYSRLLLPRLIQSDAVPVNVKFYLNSVIDFNPVSGIMTLAGVFLLYWNDEIIESNWKYCKPKKVKRAKIGINKVWFPKLYIRNSVRTSSLFEHTSFIDSETSVVTFYKNGSASMSILSVLDTMCKTDVTHFPLDSHECGLTISATSDLQDIQIFSTLSSFTHPYTYANSEWDIQTNVFSTNDKHIMEVNFVVNLSRKPTFVVANLVFPVVVITVVSGFSFLVPIESGEKLSFGISLLLMFIVFLTTVVDILPSSDKELSYFNIFIFTELIYSCIIVIGIILTLYMYYHLTDSVVPEPIRRVAKFVLRKERQASVPPHDQAKAMGDQVERKSFVVTDTFIKPMTQSSGTKENVKNMTEITWKDVARATDKVFLIFTTFLSLFLILSFITLEIIVKLKLY